MTTTRHSKSNGYVSVFVLVAMVGAVLIATASLMRVSTQSRHSIGQLSQSQTDLLFEAAIDLAKSRLASQPDYEGESWQLKKADSGLRQAAKIEVRVESNTDPEARNLEVTIEIGDELNAMFRDRRTWNISLPASEQS